MKKTLNFFLALILLSSSLSPIKAFAATEETCDNGECVPGYIDRLEDLNSLFMSKCLPKGMALNKIESHIKHNGVTEICWKYITEINYLEGLIQEQQSKLELKLGCEGSDCKMPSSTESINGQLQTLKKVEVHLCTETKKEEIARQCPADLECALVTGALGIGGYVAEYLVPEKFQPNNCHMGDDSCATQLATGFLKSVMIFFKGLWNVLKTAGSYTKEKLGKFWKWVRNAEDSSSTAQLSMAKASENEGIFKMLIDDFPGTMKKLWSGLIAAIKEWLKTDIFCSKWEGEPHFSKCLDPASSFDCIGCKALINGMCAVSGYLVAEIIPAFVTGGLVTAAKHGANGAAKIAKIFRLSREGVIAIKASRLANMAKIVDKTNDVAKISKGLRFAKNAIEAALQAIKTYLLSTPRSTLKASYSAMSELSKKSGMFLAQTKAGKIIIFNGTAIKRGTQVILYPIDNPLIAFAYKSGQRSFDKLLRFGSPKLGNKSTMIASLLAKDEKIESTLIKLEIEAMKAHPRPNYILLHEEELLQKVLPIRREILRKTFQANDVYFNDMIKTLYPELKYGDLAAKMPADKVAWAEQELFAEIHFLPLGDHRDKLLKAFEEHVAQGEARVKILKEPFQKPERLEIFDGAIVTEGEVKTTLNLGRPLIKAGPPAVKEVQKEEKKKKSEDKK